MSKPVHKPTALTSLLVAVKGQASSSAPEILAKQAAAPLPRSAGYLKAMTLKLDSSRYARLKQLGLDEGKTSQDLLTEAVDLLLERRG